MKVNGKSANENREVEIDARERGKTEGDSQ
jgi:hypothetical protein